MILLFITNRRTEKKTHIIGRSFTFMGAQLATLNMACFWREIFIFYYSFLSMPYFCYFLIPNFNLQKPAAAIVAIYRNNQRLNSIQNHTIFHNLNMCILFIHLIQSRYDDQNHQNRLKYAYNLQLKKIKKKRKKHTYRHHQFNFLLAIIDMSLKSDIIWIGYYTGSI